MLDMTIPFWVFVDFINITMVYSHWLKLPLNTNIAVIIFENDNILKWNFLIFFKAVYVTYDFDFLVICGLC